jgi:PHD and RING finger domain-containing protein 1
MRPKVHAALEAAQKAKPTIDAAAADDRAPPPDDDAAPPIVASSSPAPASVAAAAAADAPRASLPFFGDQCAICQEDVSRRGRLDSCAHLFCVPCIKRWAKIETRCPLCKARFSFIQPEDVDVAGEDGTSTDAAAPTAKTTPRGSRGAKKPPKRIYLPRRDQTYEDPDGGELADGVDVETVLCGRCGARDGFPHDRPRSRGARRSSRTFSAVSLHPRFPFSDCSTGGTFD